ncbi:MAG: D-tyrosyl-tRNA(Tyr) deacylase [Clostridia bacterium]|nr:D-tyrosyl-tRNA(Tyr) deacylase [Clostridia bacterium]
MKIVVQKVKKCVLYSEGEKYSEIKNGMLVLLGVATTDNEKIAEKIAQKILKLRIFDDENGKTNKNIFDIKGEIMVVSNFTLCSNLKGTNRPDFITAARPEQAEPLYSKVVDILKEEINVATGAFRTYMEIEMVADGPGTYVYEEN